MESKTQDLKKMMWKRTCKDAREDERTWNSNRQETEGESEQDGSMNGQNPKTNEKNKKRRKGTS